MSIVGATPCVAPTVHCGFEVPFIVDSPVRFADVTLPGVSIIHVTRAHSKPEVTLISGFSRNFPLTKLTLYHTLHLTEVVLLSAASQLNLPGQVDIHMNFKKLTFLFAMGSGLLFASSALAEEPKLEFPAASPACTLKQHVGLTDIEIDYSRPSVKNREIFGGLVPYDKVWRTGANQATKIIFSTAVKLNGTEIPAGTYALFSIPGKDEWTVVINKSSGEWGAYKYDEKLDVARIKVKAVKLEKPVETFTIEFNQIRDDSSELTLAWDKTLVPVKLEVDFVDKLSKQIETVMASDEKKKPYFQAAQFYYNHGKDLKQALKWIDAAIAERDAHYIVYVKAQILAKLGDKAAAIEAAKHSSELAEKANDLGYVKSNADLIKSLK